MASPYTSVSVSGYNLTPPVDDGSQTEANRLKYSTTKTKLSDPLKTAIEAVNTNLLTAFAKTLGGGGVTSTAVSYDVLSTDQGKLIRATASGITITTPDATDVDDPFTFAVLNNSNGTITFEGFSAQTVDGAANITVAAGAGFNVFTDGTNWFTSGQIFSAATQAEQETGTAVDKYVTPGRQHFHASACKAWCYATITGTISASYNTSSVTDTGTGDISFNWGTDFSSANYVSIGQARADPGGAAGSTHLTQAMTSSFAAGVARFQDRDAGAFAVIDPANWAALAFGDHA